MKLVSTMILATVLIISSSVSAQGKRKGGKNPAMKEYRAEIKAFHEKRKQEGQAFRSKMDTKLDGLLSSGKIKQEQYDKIKARQAKMMKKRDEHRANRKNRKRNK